MRRRRATAVTLLGVGALLALPGAAQAQFFCPKVQFFYAAGSGGSQKPNLRLRTELERGLDVDNVFSRFVNYPARAIGGWTPDETGNKVGAFFRVGDVGAYHDSVVDGKNWLRTKVRQVIANCPAAGTKIVLSGYSQGAQVVADVYQEMERRGQADAIFGVILFGDPYFNESAAGRSASNGKLRPGGKANGMLGRRPGYGALRDRVRSYCHRRDPICQGDRPAGGANAAWIARLVANFADGDLSMPDHSTYDTSGEANDAGRWLSTRLRAALMPATAPAPTVGQTETPPVPGGEVSPEVAPAPTYTEQQGSRGVDTFQDYSNASGKGQRIEPNQYVQVACKVYAPQIASVNPDGYWYRIATSPWNNQYYAPANTFWNGDVPGQKPYTHNTDFAVPDC